MEHDEIEPGDTITGFNLITPGTDAAHKARVAEVCAAGHLDALPPRRCLTVVANGPSAKDVDLQSVEGPTLALNGSIGLFVEQGVVPTYWAACDPQETVASFLPDHPFLSTTYLLGSKVHQAVFDKLKGLDVQVWHLPDSPAPGRLHIPLCSTVTICASWLMFRLGFTDFEYWGWDGCFINGQDHAAHNVGQEPTLWLNYGGVLAGGRVIGGRNFDTSRAWAAEAKSAEQFFQLAKYFDIGVTLHGDGMFKAVQSFIMSPDKPQ